MSEKYCACGCGAVVRRTYAVGHGMKGKNARLETSAQTEKRFWSKVDRKQENQCWMWLDTPLQSGYGRFYIRGIPKQAHRVSYELLVGPIPEGKCLDHLCRNTLCVNPKHLDPVSNRENILRGVGITAKRFSSPTCIHGHQLFGDNLYVTRQGHRRCRTCLRVSQRKYEEKWSEYRHARKR